MWLISGEYNPKPLSIQTCLSELSKIDLVQKCFLSDWSND
jgi:hypothetical protein